MLKYNYVNLVLNISDVSLVTFQHVICVYRQLFFSNCLVNIVKSKLYVSTNNIVYSKNNNSN